jgi:hypothetical protein
MHDDINIIDSCSASVEERLKAAERLAISILPDLDSVCEIDLHCHSFCSDGYCSPSNIVFGAFRRKMKAVAIADHDSFDGQLEAIAAGGIFNIDVIPAIEFYTNRTGVEIIGHFPDVENFIDLIESGDAEATVETIRNAKTKQLSGMVDRIPVCFDKLGFRAEITQNDIDQYVKNGISTKGDISVIMTLKYGAELKESGISEDVKDFQARYTTKDDMINLPLELDMDISPEEFVRKICHWGGLPGLSHPTELRKKEGLGNDDLYRVLQELIRAGLQTIEVDGWRNGVCPETGLNQTDLFDKMRKELNKELGLDILFTNGSDNHDQPGEGLELGCGRNRNLRPEFGTYENIIRLREKAKSLD